MAVFAPIRGVFHYLPPESLTVNEFCKGQRVWVPFGRGFRVGVVMDTDCVPENKVRLKNIVEILDSTAYLSPPVIELARWASGYYHYPLGETLAHSFPASLRKRKKVSIDEVFEWSITEAGKSSLVVSSLKGVRQIELLSRLSLEPSMNAEGFMAANFRFAWRPVLERLVKKNLVARRKFHPSEEPDVHEGSSKISLNSDQNNACEIILDKVGRYEPVMLYGVTGSGKTEVYMEVIENLLKKNEQSLVLVPEITLTEQILERFRKRFGGMVGVLHSQCKESEKIAVWNGCRTGEVKILIGTRSSVWVPMKRLGLIVVDEEHDASFKQQDGLSYSGRDLAIKRGQIEKVPVVLGSATPSLETLANVSAGRYLEVRLSMKAKAISEPARELVDIGKEGRSGGVGFELSQAIRKHVSEGGQVLLFLNRRGYAPFVMCRTCGVHQTCENCERHLVYHKLRNSLVCHHCGKCRKFYNAVPCCNKQVLFDLGFGTEQIEEKVQQLFPDLKVSRIDRDKIRKPSAVREVFRRISNHEIDILIGTQMIAKGLDFSGITLVGIIDTDNRLYSVDYRSEERLAQLLTQVAGRCGRNLMESKVLIQSSQPDNPTLRKIIYEGYRAYSLGALEERRRMGMPPFSALAIIKADSPDERRSDGFLASLKTILAKNVTSDEVFLSHPIPSLAHPKHVKYRSLMVLQSRERRILQQFLSDHISRIEGLGRKMKVRWFLEVDPEDTL